jgi:hypothetical protein
MTGWNSVFLQSAINTCTNPSGRIEDCPLFNVVDEATATSCKMKKSLLQNLFGENVVGPMASLPGGVPVGGGTGNENKPASTSSRQQAPSLTYRPGDKPSNPATPLPGQAFKEKSQSASAPRPSSESVAVAALAVQPTPAPPPPPATPSAQHSYYSTQYVTNGNRVTEILWEEKFVTVTEYGDSPAPTPADAIKHARRRGHHLHGHARY